MEERAQRVADEAANLGLRYLPFAAEAKVTAEAFLMQEGFPACSVVDAGTDAVSVRLDCSFESGFAKFFGASLPIPLSAYAEVRMNPIDIFIALDTGSAVAPREGALWGDESEWPVADFFSQEYPVHLDGRPLDARYLTQQCFNPLFSVLKRTAIQLYDYFIRFNLNAVGIGFFPGQIHSLYVARSALPPGLRGDGIGEAQSEKFVSVSSADSLCAAAAEREQHARQYHLPSLNEEIMSPYDFAAGRPLAMTMPPSFEFNPEYLPFALSRELIWTKAAKSGAPYRTSAVIEEIAAQLLADRSRLFEKKHSRGGLKNQALKVALILAADLPAEGEARFPAVESQEAIKQSLARIRDFAERTSTTFLLFYVLGPETKQQEHGEAFALLDEIFRQASSAKTKEGGVQAQLLIARSPEVLLTQVSGLISMSTKKNFVAR